MCIYTTKVRIDKCQKVACWFQLLFQLGNHKDQAQLSLDPCAKKWEVNFIIQMLHLGD
jgi:hypothetical protein